MLRGETVTGQSGEDSSHPGGLSEKNSFGLIKPCRPGRECLRDKPLGCIPSQKPSAYPVCWDSDGLDPGQHVMGRSECITRLDNGVTSQWVRTNQCHMIPTNVFFFGGGNRINSFSV